MAHRTAEDQLHHIREARQYIDDDRLGQSERALTAIASGEYKGARSRESGDGAANRTYREDRPWGLAPQDSADPRNEREPTPAMVRQRLQRTRVVPRILEESCTEHGAAPREFCFPSAHGVCAERVKARAARP